MHGAIVHGMRRRIIAVYVLASHNRRLYVGITSDLVRRIHQHRLGRGSAFAIKYRMNRLVYWEEHRSVIDAMRRERQLKHWPWAKMAEVIGARNAGWRDLSLLWFREPAVPR